MVDGRQRDQWLHTCEVIAMIANTVRNPKKRRKPYRGKDLYPFKTPPTSLPNEELANIKDVLGLYGLRHNKRTTQTETHREG